MIEIAIIMLAACFIALVIGGSVYLSHTRTQVEQTKRMEMQEKTKRQALDNAFFHEQVEQEKLQLMRGDAAVTALRRDIFDVNGRT